MKTKRKISPLRSSSFSCPKLGEDQKIKKVLYLDSVRLCAQTFSPSYKGGGGGGGMPQFRKLFYANYTILATQRRGPWCHAPLNTPLYMENIKHCYIAIGLHYLSNHEKKTAKFAEVKRHLRLQKWKKLPQTYRKLANLRLRTTYCYFAVAK